MPPATQEAPRSSVRCTRTDQPSSAARRATDSPMTPPPTTATVPGDISAPFAGMTRIRCDGKGQVRFPARCAPARRKTAPLSVPSPGTPVFSRPRYSGARPVANVADVPDPQERLARRLAQAHLYLCTDARRERGDLAEFVDAALAGGVDIVQLRDKGSVGEQRFGPLEARAELAALEVLADAARRHGALLAVNDRADIARAAGADVLHLGQDDLPLDVARDVIGPEPADRPLDARPRAGGRRGRRGCRLLLRRPLLAHPDQTGPVRAGPRPGPRRRGNLDRQSHGSRSEESTPNDYPRCSTRAPGGWWWCGRSPAPTTRPPRQPR